MKVISLIRTLVCTCLMLIAPTIVLAQQVINSDLHVTGKLGVGTTSPATQLHVNGALKLTSSYGNLTLGSMDANYVHFNTDRPAFYFNKPIFLQSIVRTTGAIITFYTHTTTPCMTLLHDRVGIGTSSPMHKLEVNGNVRVKNITVDSLIRAEEIIVETTGADFVFADDYQLRPLSEVKSFITENKHLPEIQSAQEMQENGVSVSELQTKLLQKIEELTLYLIEQEQTIQELRQEVEQLLLDR